MKAWRLRMRQAASGFSTASIERNRFAEKFVDVVRYSELQCRRTHKTSPSKYVCGLS
jgi:hypothetical protein